MKEKDLSQTLNDLLDEFGRLDAEANRVSDRIGEREIVADRQTLREPSEIDLLYSDPQVIDFWKTEGQRYSYLYWVRAMIHRKVEPVRVDPCVVPVAEDRADRDRQRMTVYRLFEELLDNPSRDLAGRIASGALVEALRAVPMALSGHPLIDEGLADLDKLQWQDEEKLLDEIRMEYARIIYDSFFPYVAPYESIYLGDRQVQGNRTGQVYQSYNAAGLKAEGEFPDHIMHECAFIAELIRRRLEEDETTATKAQEHEDRFLTNHLLPWATRFGHDFTRVATMREENSRERPAQSYATGIGKLVTGFFTLEANRFNARKPFADKVMRFAQDTQAGGAD